MLSRTGASSGVGWFVMLLVALAAGRASRTPGYDLALVWPAAGVITLGLLACRTWRGRATVSASALAAVVVLVLLTESGVRVAVISGALTVVGAAAAALTGRLAWRDARATLREVTDLVRLCAVALTGAVASMLAFATAVRLAEGAVPHPVAVGVVGVRSALGTLLVLAAFLAWRDGARRPSLRTFLGWGLDAVVTVAWTALVILGGGPLLTYALVPLTVLVALRHDVLRTVVHLVVASVTTVVLARATLPPTDQLERALSTQGFLAVLVLVGLGLAVLRGEQRAALSMARQASATLRRMVDGALIAQLILDGEDGSPVVARANPAAAAFFGCATDDLVGVSWLGHVDPAHRKVVAEAVRSVATGAVPSWTGEVRHRPATGASRWAQVSIAPVADGDTRSLSIQLLDITARKDVEGQLAHLALHDVLTGLANRTLLSDRVHHALVASRRSGTRVALVFLDLDHFKAVNDRFGHGTGDAILVEVGNRLRAEARGSDTVARLGGDEFVVCCPGIASEEEAHVVAERLVATVSRPIVVDGVERQVRVSAGLTVSDVGSTVESLLLESDTAMYEAKRRGRGRLEPYADTLTARAARMVEVEEELVRALERHELRVLFQPILTLADGVTEGYEALVRWQHPTRGLLAPGEWLDVAEDSGLIAPIGAFVLREACRQVAELDDTSTVHVNVSARQLQDSRIVEVAMSAAAAARLDPRRLVLELTETHLVEVDSSLLADLEQLRANGVRIAADDFGTGYSALQQLVELPIDVLKIDRSFVSGIAQDPRASAVVHALLAMSDELGLSVVAEGVETREQADALRTAGCLLAQGFLWARPAPLPGPSARSAVGASSR